MMMTTTMISISVKPRIRRGREPAARRGGEDSESLHEFHQGVAAHRLDRKRSES